MDNYKIITCAGFGYTGSGVINDFLSEFPDIYTESNECEFRFLHDYGGISTLEDNLVFNYHHQNSVEAINNFRKMVDYYSGTIFSRKYNEFLNGQFKDVSEKFLKDLVQVEFEGHLETIAIFKPAFWRLITYQVVPHLKALLFRQRVAKYYPKSNMSFSMPSKDYFDECVKKYLCSIFKIIDDEHKYKFLFFDHLVPPVNVNRYFDYFDQLKVIVVDRDPRDLYVQNIYRKIYDPAIPYDVYSFIRLYKEQRLLLNREVDNSNVLRVNFEDTIYQYDDFCREMKCFIGLNDSQHSLRRKKFDPSISIKNTQLWKKYDVPLRIIELIENELGDYCYSFK